MVNSQAPESIMGGIVAGVRHRIALLGWRPGVAAPIVAEACGGFGHLAQPLWSQVFPNLRQREIQLSWSLFRSGKRHLRLQYPPIAGSSYSARHMPHAPLYKRRAKHY
jgi:hypothetical protein